VEEIAVDTNTLSNDIQALQEALNYARQQLNDMFSQIHEMDAMWDGPANSEFNAQFQKDYEFSMDLCSVIEALLECMEGAKAQYNACEESVGGIVCSIMV